MNARTDVLPADDYPLALANRSRGAIWGQLVGDAAALGCHWIYDLDELKKRFPGGIEGFETPQDSQYHQGKQSGDHTHYGEAALILLESVSELGRFDAKHFGNRFCDHFGAPDYKGYLDKPTKGTLAAKADFEKQNPGEPFDFQQGADDDQVVSGTRMAPVVVAHFGQGALLSKVEEATRVCQNNQRTVNFMQAFAILLVELLEGREVNSAVEMTAEHMRHHPPHGEEIAELIERGSEASVKETTEATMLFGQSCSLDEAFPSSIQALVRYPNDFKSAILEVLKAGGDNAGRAALVGAWLGAANGAESIPAHWIHDLNSRERIRFAVERLIDGPN